MTKSGTDEKPLILIVDDEWLNRELLEGVFEADGFAVLLAHNGDAARKRLEKRPLPDVALIDVRMDDVDGYTLCREIKDQPDTAALVIVLMTALEIDTEVREKVAAAGADGIIHRGESIDQFVKTVRHLMDSSQSQKPTTE